MGGGQGLGSAPPLPATLVGLMLGCKDCQSRGPGEEPGRRDPAQGALNAPVQEMQEGGKPVPRDAEGALGEPHGPGALGCTLTMS